MSICTDDLLELAKSLQGSTLESELRTSVSRAYYAAYHEAKAWHDTRPSPGSAPAGMGVHRKLIERLKNPTVTGDAARKDSRAIGYMLDVMKVSRQLADYRLSDSVTAELAANTVAQAARLLEKAR